MAQLMPRDQLEGLERILRRLEVAFRGTGKPGPNGGLCGQIADMEESEDVHISSHALKALFRHAGYENTVYPVPMPEEFEPDYVMFIEDSDRHTEENYNRNEWAYDMLNRHGWDIHHPYGQARWKFIDDLRKSIKHLLHFTS